MCHYCDRKIGRRKDGLRKKHYINERSGWGYRLKECRGSSPDGTVPYHHTKTVANQRRNGRMKCLACDEWVKFTQAFVPVKHADLRGKVCAGWSDNQ